MIGRLLFSSGGDQPFLLEQQTSVLSERAALEHINGEAEIELIRVHRVVCTRIADPSCSI